MIVLMVCFVICLIVSGLFAFVLFCFSWLFVCLLVLRLDLTSALCLLVVVCLGICDLDV